MAAGGGLAERSQAKLEIDLPATELDEINVKKKFRR
jgi:hypothetical protein